MTPTTTPAGTGTANRSRPVRRLDLACDKCPDSTNPKAAWFRGPGPAVPPRSLEDLLAVGAGLRVGGERRPAERAGLVLPPLPRFPLAPPRPLALAVALAVLLQLLNELRRHAGQGDVVGGDPRGADRGVV